MSLFEARDIIDDRDALQGVNFHSATFHVDFYPAFPFPFLRFAPSTFLLGPLPGTQTTMANRHIPLEVDTDEENFITIVSALRNKLISVITYR